MSAPFPVHCGHIGGGLAPGALIQFKATGAGTGVASATPSTRLSTPEDVANTILFLGSAANGNITPGELLRVSGGRQAGCTEPKMITCRGVRSPDGI